MVTPEDSGSEATAAEPVADSRVATRLRAFAARHGEPAQAVVSYLGRGRTRIVVTAGDGQYADAVVPSVEVANLTCEQAGIAVDGWIRDITSRITLTPAQRRRMATIGRPGI